MLERGGSDIERLCNWISGSTQNELKMSWFKFRVVLCRIRLFPTLISIMKWHGWEPPLNDRKLLPVSKVDINHLKMSETRKKCGQRMEARWKHDGNIKDCSVNEFCSLDRTLKFSFCLIFDSTQLKRTQLHFIRQKY